MNDLNKEAEKIAENAVKTPKIKEAGVGVDTSIMASDRGIMFLDLDAVDFNPQYNVRDAALAGDRVARKVNELRLDGVIRTPLVACATETFTEGGVKPIGACGFLRHAALCWLRTNDPEFFKAKFEGRIPFRIYENCPESEREKLLFDHGSEEELDIVEVMKSLQRLVLSGRGEPEIANIMAKSFAKLASAKDRQKWIDRLAELNKNGCVLVGGTMCRDAATVSYHTWRGRIQYFKRVVNAPKCAYNNWIAFQRGDKTAVALGYKDLELLTKMTDAEAEAWLAVRVAPATDSGDSGEPAPVQKVWQAATLMGAKNATNSAYIRTIFSATCGDAAAAQRIPAIEEELVKIEEAMRLDANAFWFAVESIIEDAPKH